METKHTLGNWVTDCKSFPPDQVFNNAGVIVADCKWTGVTLDERIANACLIAAAPELLRALIGILEGDSPNWVDVARAAIAKATGVQS